MKPAFGLFAVFLLAGCLPDWDKSKEVAVCRNEADRFYQAYNNIDADSPRGRYIIACMGTKGYTFEISLVDCDSHHPLVIQSACYAKQGWIASLLDRFRSR